MSITFEEDLIDSADPFLRWVGGKRQLLPIIEANLPPYDGNKSTFFEPFLGGGAVFFNVDYENNHLNDVNHWLIQTYYVLTNDRLFDKLIRELKTPKYKNNERTFMRLRSRFNTLKKTDGAPKVKRTKRTKRAECASPSVKVEIVALFVYLNYTCFNGLYRENSNGEFNVSFGKRYNIDFPKVAIDKMKQAREYMMDRNIKFSCGSYKNALRKAKKGDFVYIDPPYYPLNPKRSFFTKYSGRDFGQQDHIDLISECARLSAKGCYVMYSNANAPFIKKAFGKLPGKRWRIRQVSARRNVSRDAATRAPKGKIEILVTNY